MKKNIIIYLLIGIGLLAICGMLYASYTLNKEQKALDSHLIKLSVEELKTKIDNKDTFILVFAGENCSHCQLYLPKLKTVLKEHDIQAYEVITDQFNSDNESDMEKYNYLLTIANFSGTPTTSFIVNGEEINTASRIVGESSYEQITSRLKAMGYIND